MGKLSELGVEAPESAAAIAAGLVAVDWKSELVAGLVSFPSFPMVGTDLDLVLPAESDLAEATQLTAVNRPCAVWREVHLMFLG